MDYMEAIVGADTPEKVAAAAERMALSADAIRDKASLASACRAAKLLMTKAVSVATHNVNVASKAGLLPSRWLGVDSIDAFPAGIAATSTGNRISTQPSIEVRINGLRTDSAFAADFSIEDIKVSTVSINVGDQGAPATAFTTGIALPPLSTVKASAGSPVLTTVANLAGAVRRFRAVYTLSAVGDPCGA